MRNIKKNNDALNLTFQTLKMTFWISQWNPSLDSWSISSQRSCIQEIKKSYQTAFEKIDKTRGLSAWELRCLIIHGLWYRAQWSLMNTQWPWFDLSTPPNVKCHGVNWKTIYDLLYRRFIQNLIRCSIYEIQPFETHVTLIWPWKVIQGQMSWGKLIVHRWLPICVRTCLVYEIYPTENPMTLICPFNFIKGQMLQGKLKGHMWLTICISYTLWSYDAPFMRHNHLKGLWPWFDI